jgi:hypothetical protein
VAEIFNGRYTARTDKPLVLFLIGLRLSKLWAAHKWLPVFAAMPRMLSELDRKPEAGLLSHRLYHSGRIFLVQQYWDSFDKLIAYAHDTSAQHFPAWAAFNHAVSKDGTVGIWHETYPIEPGKYETIYANMPLFGLAGAATHVRAEAGLSAARDRLRGY